MKFYKGMLSCNSATLQGLSRSFKLTSNFSLGLRHVGANILRTFEELLGCERFTQTFLQSTLFVTQVLLT